MMSKSTAPSQGRLLHHWISLSFSPLRIMIFSFKSFTAQTFSLQDCKRKKGMMRLRLLLTYVQNGIEEPWQRIPSIITLFAAEASFILLEPSHHHYAALSKFLVRSSRMNRKVILLRTLYVVHL